jgi:RNA polymerase sigma-70 factor (ECF subfamily)
MLHEIDPEAVRFHSLPCQLACRVTGVGTDLGYSEGNTGKDMQMPRSTEFHHELTSLLPRMRVWALGLTRNSAEADDLVQDVAAKTLAAYEAFTLGTNFSAWVHRIMINHFISGCRNRRQFTSVEEMPESPVTASHEDRLALLELSHVLPRLPRDQLAALSQIALQEKSYEEVAEQTGEAVGTLKSRVHRARGQLRSFLEGDPSHLAA